MVTRVHTSKIALECPTRVDLSCMATYEISVPLKVRTAQYVKWELLDIDGQDIEGLPTYTRSQISAMAEADLPKKAIINYRKRPKWLFREIPR